MTATDELRRLLDERGVEYFSIDLKDMGGRTMWYDANDLKWCFDDAAETSLTVLYSTKYGLTPEQAITATLGNDGVGRTNDGVADALQAKVKAQSDYINKLRGEYKALDEQMERRCAEYRVMICKLKAELDAATLGNDGVGRTNDGVAERERDQLKAENAKLRELVKDMWSAYHDGATNREFRALPDRLRELGVDE